MGTGGAGRGQCSVLGPGLERCGAESPFSPCPSRPVSRRRQGMDAMCRPRASLETMVASCGLSLGLGEGAGISPKPSPVFTRLPGLHCHLSWSSSGWNSGSQTPVHEGRASLLVHTSGERIAGEKPRGGRLPGWGPHPPVPGGPSGLCWPWASPLTGPPGPDPSLDVAGGHHTSEAGWWASSRGGRSCREVSPPPEGCSAAGSRAAPGGSSAKAQGRARCLCPPGLRVLIARGLPPRQECAGPGPFPSQCPCLCKLAQASHFPCVNTGTLQVAPAELRPVGQVLAFLGSHSHCEGAEDPRWARLLPASAGKAHPGESCMGLRRPVVRGAPLSPKTGLLFLVLRVVP